MAARHDDRQADRRDGRGAAVSRRLQRLDDADQGAHRHAVDRHPHAGRHQGLRQRPRRDGAASRAQIEAVVRDGAGHDQRLRRARHRRLLPRHRARSRAARALRPDGRRRAGRDRDRARRRDGDHHGRRPRALRRQRALSARAAQRSAGDRARRCWCRCTNGGTVPLGQVAKVSLAQGPADDPHRERAAGRLHLCRHPRPRHRRLCRRRAEGGGASRSSSRPATTSPGAASSSTWSAPRRG